MKDLKYTVIKSKEQYDEYCWILEGLTEKATPLLNDEIELLTLLIEKWDEDNSFINVTEDPVKLLKALMNEHNLKAKDLTEILGLSKSTISKILNYQKGMSKETIRKLASYFRVSQDIFNRPYGLVAEPEAKYKSTKKSDKFS